MRHLRQHHLARLHAREGVVGFPVGGIGFADRGDLAGDEGFPHGGAVAEEFQPDLVDHVGPAPKAQVRAPVIGVAAQRHEASRLEIVDHVGCRGNRDHVDTALGKVAALPLGGLEDRTHPHDQRQFPVGLRKADAHAPFPNSLDRGNAGPGIEITRMPLGAERLVGPDHVRDGDRASVGKARFRAQVKFHPGSALADLDRFGQETVERERFVPTAPHERRVGQEAQLPRRAAGADMRVEAVETAHFPGHDPPARGGIGIGIGQMRKIWWQCRLTIHSDAMRRLCQRRPGENRHRPQDGRDSRETISAHV